VVVSPGRTEPIEKYFEVAQRLTARGFTVLVHDWRSHGLSFRPGAASGLGHANGYADFVTDYDALLERFADRLPKPWLAMGHSMGGCLTLLVLALGERRFAGAMLSAPMLGIRTGQISLPLARLMARLTVALGLGTARMMRDPAGAETFASNILTHDPVRYARNVGQVAEHPELAVGAPSWGWLDFAFRAIAILQRGPGVTAITIPLTVAAAGEEALVDNAAIERVTARVPGARYVVVGGAYHEILQETDAIQDRFWAEFDALAERAAV
jgi:lysophospholipase